MLSLVQKTKELPGASVQPHPHEMLPKSLENNELSKSEFPLLAYLTLVVHVEKKHCQYFI